MKKNIIVDTSVFISSFLVADKNNLMAKRFFEFIRKKKLIITIPVIAFLEILHAYFRITGNIEATDKLYKEMIEWNFSKKLRIVNIESSFLVYFCLYHNLFNVKTADAVIAITAHRLKYPLITFDKKLMAATKSHIRIFTPAKFILS